MYVHTYTQTYMDTYYLHEYIIMYIIYTHSVIISNWFSDNTISEELVKMMSILINNTHIYMILLTDKQYITFLICKK